MQRDTVVFTHIPFVKHSIPQISQNALDTKPKYLLRFLFFFFLTFMAMEEANEQHTLKIRMEPVKKPTNRSYLKSVCPH